GSQIPLDGLAFDEELESGRLVLVGADLHAFVLGDFNGDGVRDLAATTPADKMVRIFTARPQGAFEAEFFQDRFLNGGDSPGPLAAADFNEDGVDDLAVVSTSLGQVTLLLSEDGGFHATLELPMPLKPTWAAGQIVPAGGLVADFGRPPGSGTALPDDREDLLIYTEPVPQRWLLPGEEDEPEVKISSVTLLFTYLGLGSPVGPDYAPVKASVSHRMTAPLSGAATGDFDGDGFPDVVVATRTAPDSLTTGGNFDILRGGLNPLVTQPTGNGTEVEHGVAGRFWPLGGFIGPENPSGVATARLNGDVLDDLVFIAPESGSISDPATFQYAKAVGLLTRYNKGWNSCPGSYNQVSFLCCAPEDTALPCPPSVDDLCLSFTPNVCEGAQSQMNALGKDPTAVAVDLINGDDVPDVVVVNRASFNFTYFQGLRQGDQYLFQSPQEPPNLYPIGADPIDIDIGNLDDDGLPDVVAALSSSIVVIYGRDEPLHEFELGIPLDKGPDSQDMTPSGVLMADVNMDGYVDIVASSTHKSLIWIYISAGDRAFLGPFPFDCGRDPVDVLRIDFDVDGCPDLAVVNAGSKTVSLLRNERCD
ncbi:MAG: VCBS repeat-containing protein, partial [Deltaproteobacteria bacterium]|nr:VCBS repeat-containing protein [Deltaproteobacteria bacterium]